MPGFAGHSWGGGAALLGCPQGSLLCQPRFWGPRKIVRCPLKPSGSQGVPEAALCCHPPRACRVGSGPGIEASAPIYLAARALPSNQKNYILMLKLVLK